MTCVYCADTGYIQGVRCGVCEEIKVRDAALKKGREMCSAALDTRIAKLVRWEGERPKYSSDLNAMHKAEEALGIGAQEEYQKNLAWVTSYHKGLLKLSRSHRGVQWYVTHASARHKAEAFIMTVTEPIPEDL